MIRRLARVHAETIKQRAANACRIHPETVDGANAVPVIQFLQSVIVKTAEDYAREVIVLNDELARRMDAEADHGNDP